MSDAGGRQTSATNAGGAAGCVTKSQPGSQSGRVGAGTTDRICTQDAGQGLPGIGRRDGNRVLEGRVFTSDSKDTESTYQTAPVSNGSDSQYRDPVILYCHKYQVLALIGAI